MRIEIKLKRNHPAGKMRLGRHIITNQFSFIELSDAELMEYKSEGGQYWFEEKAQQVVKDASEFKGERAKRKSIKR